MDGGEHRGQRRQVPRHVERPRRGGATSQTTRCELLSKFQ